ncbi:unnamed protein product [Linum trigynum]|uniref:Uncharacterized protein n=1 Tax=Linum trigynum TaxID=586398 RepID=A0AAV2DSR5_9ROSI
MNIKSKVQWSKTATPSGNYTLQFQHLLNNTTSPFQLMPKLSKRASINAAMSNRDKLVIPKLEKNHSKIPI